MYSGRRARERRAPLLCSAAALRCAAAVLLLSSAVLTAFVACAFTRRTEHAARYRSYSALAVVPSQRRPQGGRRAHRWVGARRAAARAGAARRAARRVRGPQRRDRSSESCFW